MIDNVTGVRIETMIQELSARRGITRDEAKAILLDTARAVCAPPPPKRQPVQRPVFQVLIPFAGTA